MFINSFLSLSHSHKILNEVSVLFFFFFLAQQIVTTAIFMIILSLALYVNDDISVQTLANCTLCKCMQIKCYNEYILSSASGFMYKTKNCTHSSSFFFFFFIMCINTMVYDEYIPVVYRTVLGCIWIKAHSYNRINFSLLNFVWKMQ